MTRIFGLGEPAPRRVLRKASDGGERFAVPAHAAMARESAEADHTSASAPARGLASMLAVQETAIGAVSEQRRRRDQAARRRGQELLGALAELQRAMLGSSGVTVSRAAMQALLDGVPVAADPALAGVVQAIALRAQVELARVAG